MGRHCAGRTLEHHVFDHTYRTVQGMPGCPVHVVQQLSADGQSRHVHCAGNAGRLGHTLCVRSIWCRVRLAQALSLSTLSVSTYINAMVPGSIGPFPDLVSCSAHGNYFFTTYQCAQYPDHCLKTLVTHWINPLQQSYLDIVSASGHGGFVHSCFLGAYWNSPPYPNPVLAALPEDKGGTGNQTRMWWHQIRIGGVSMYDAMNACELRVA
jgi:hypothetical protein